MMRLDRLLILILLSACALHTQAQGSRAAAGEIRSVITDWSYPLRVYLPAGYETSQHTYPVLYAVDAEVRFDRLADMLDEFELQIIMIGIANTGNERREVDFIMPGAKAYADFLTDELVPWVDNRYRTDPTARGMAGHSLGGLISALTMLSEAPDMRRFNTFLISDGSFWNQPAATQELFATLNEQTRSLPVRLFVTGATRGNIRGVRFFLDELINSNLVGLDLTYRVYQQSHKDVQWPSFRDGLLTLYAGRD